jgi:hypothetical protein
MHAYTIYASSSSSGLHFLTGGRVGSRSGPADRACRAHPEPAVDALDVEHVAARWQQLAQLTVHHRPEADRAPHGLGRYAALPRLLVGLTREHRQRAQRLVVQAIRRVASAEHDPPVVAPHILHLMRVGEAFAGHLPRAAAPRPQVAPRVEVERGDERDGRQERGHRDQQEVDVEVMSERHGRVIT